MRVLLLLLLLLPFLLAFYIDEKVPSQGYVLIYSEREKWYETCQGNDCNIVYHDKNAMSYFETKERLLEHLNSNNVRNPKAFKLEPVPMEYVKRGTKTIKVEEPVEKTVDNFIWE